MPSSSASGSASGVKTSVSIPFGIVVKRREGKYGCSESTTASETLMEASRRRKTAAKQRARNEQGAIVLRDDAVERADGHGARERMIAVIGSIAPNGLCTCTTSKRWRR